MTPRIALVGDTFGVDALLKACPRNSVAALVAASIRPGYIEDLRAVAERLSIPLLIQPKVGAAEYSGFLRQFESLGITHLICYSYSMLLREDLLKLVAFNAVNVHSALLPRNRGPNPVQWAIIKGEEMTGVTMHYMDKGFDSGDIVAARQVPILFEDTWATLAERIHVAACRLMEETIPQFINGKAVRVQQDQELATSNFRLTPDSPEIRFDRQGDLEIYNLIRAQVMPLQGAYVNGPEGVVRFPRLLSLNEIRSLRAVYAPHTAKTPV